MGAAPALRAGEMPAQPNLDPLLFGRALWSEPMASLKGETGAQAPEPRPRDAFAWLSSSRQALRAGPETFTLLGRQVGEVVLRGDDGNANDATISLYNRGDDGEIPVPEFQRLLARWKSDLDGKLAVRAETRRPSGAVATDGWMWRKGGTAYLLEGSVQRVEKRPEFIRLRVAPISKITTAPSRMARRGSFASNVRMDGLGFTWIDGVPMVDQGRKGYCVAATVERAARYFGADIDQHEIAQLAHSSGTGTSSAAMERALQRITGRIHVRTLKHIAFDQRQLARDIRGYNRAARAAAKPTFDPGPDPGSLRPVAFWREVDAPVFRDMKRGQNGFKHFERKIKGYVDQGIPLCWSLYLGMFPEEGLPQTSGGHMRMIIGYNFSSSDPAKHTIRYTDSWGAGHETKTMRADEAFSMTLALYSMVPSR